MLALQACPLSLNSCSLHGVERRSRTDGSNVYALAVGVLYLVVVGMCAVADTLRHSDIYSSNLSLARHCTDASQFFLQVFLGETRVRLAEI